VSGRRVLKSEIWHLPPSEAWCEAWLDAVTNDPLLPGRILPSDYLGQSRRPSGWRRWAEVRQDTG
jgi:hypothetical protein